ncbi:MAG: TolC family protein, partial [Verrucomicrobiales bacterium]
MVHFYRTFSIPSRSKFYRLVGCLALLLLSAGCLTRPGTTRNLLGLEIPAAYHAAATAASRSGSDTGWIHSLGDSSLPALVTEALKHNHDLKSAAARMAAAGANARNIGADRFPQASLDGDGRRFQRVLTRSTRLLGSSGDEVVSDRVNDFGLNLNLSWEVDLWGKLRDRTRAAHTDYVASQVDYYAARLSLAAGTARAWFNLVESEAQTDLAEQTHANFQSAYEIVDGGFTRGVNPALDVRLARANVAGAKAQVSARRRERDQARKTLEVLLGRYPAGSLASPNELPALTSAIPSGLPSELLNRRPDLVAAEFRLESSLKRSLASRKERLPSIRLTGNSGLNSDELSRTLDLERLVWN